MRSSRLLAAAETRRALEAALLSSRRSSLSSSSSALTPYLIPSLFQQSCLQLTSPRRSVSSTAARGQAASQSASAHDKESEDVKGNTYTPSSTLAAAASKAQERPQRESWTSLQNILDEAAKPSAPPVGSSQWLLRSRTSGRIETSRMLQPQSASQQSPGSGSGGLSRAANVAAATASGKSWEFSQLFPSALYASEPNITATEAELAGPKQKLSPSLGRSVTVDPSKGMDVARAFRTVEIKCSQNSIKNHLYRQRFHERPGLRRKRLRSERWRYRFKTAFQATVRRVEALTRQGW